MRIQMVMEARDEYYSFEMARAARKLADEILNLQPGQRVVITADSQSDMRVVWASAQAAFAAGAVPVVLYYHTQAQPQLEPPAPVAAAVAAADVWIEHAVMYTMYTEAWHQALASGVQYCELGGMDVDGMVRCIGRQNVNLLAEMGEQLITFLTDCREFRVTSDLGTDITMSNVGVQVGKFKMKANPERIPIMIPGQVSWQPLEESLNGRIIADGILYPPAEVGLLNEPMSFDVVNGRIVDVDGGREAALLTRWLEALNDTNVYRIAHVSYGFNPGIPSPTGRIVEDERAFGDIDFGWGAWVSRPAAGHFDFTVRSVSTWTDDVQLADRGRFVHPRLAELCRKMGVAAH